MFPFLAADWGSLERIGSSRGARLVALKRAPTFDSPCCLVFGHNTGLVKFPSYYWGFSTVDAAGPRATARESAFEPWNCEERGAVAARWADRCCRHPDERGSAARGSVG